MSDTLTRVYELGFILVPSMPETEVPSQLEAIKEMIAKVEGTVHSAGTPEFIDLAYTIEKNVASKKMKWSQGYFGWIKFEAAPEAMEALKKILDANTSIIRYLTVKSDIENTVIFKKPKLEAKRASAEEEVVLEEEVAEDDMQEDHEKLPDLEADITDEPVQEEVKE